MLRAGFPRILENKLIFLVLEMSMNLTKSGNVLEKPIACEKST